MCRAVMHYGSEPCAARCCCFLFLLTRLAACFIGDDVLDAMGLGQARWHLSGPSDKHRTAFVCQLVSGRYLNI